VAYKLEDLIGCGRARRKLLTVVPATFINTRRSAMRILVISRPKFPIPPEQLPALFQAFAAWRERYRSVSE
jgi:hypothetical protein